MKKNNLKICLLLPLFVVAGCKDKQPQEDPHEHNFTTVDYTNDDFDLIDLTVKYCNTCDETQTIYSTKTNNNIQVEHYNISDTNKQYKITYFNDDITNMYVDSYFEYNQYLGKHINCSRDVFKDIDMFETIDLKNKTLDGVCDLYLKEEHRWINDATFTLQFDENSHPIKYVYSMIDDSTSQSVVMRESIITYENNYTVFNIHSKAKSFFEEELVDQYDISGTLQNGRFLTRQYKFFGDYYLNDKDEYFYNSNDQLTKLINYDYDNKNDSFYKQWNYTFEYDSKGRMISEKEDKIISENSTKTTQILKYEYDKFDNITRRQCFDNTKDDVIYLYQDRCYEYNLKDRITSETVLIYNEDESVNVDESFKRVYSHTDGVFSEIDYIYNPDTKTWIEIEF